MSSPPISPRSQWTRIGIAVLAAIVAVNLVLLILDAVLPGPSGPASSSYATSSRGLAGLAGLLERSGHPVKRLRDLPGRATLDPRATAVVLEPDFLRVDEARALRRFVAGGGRLVAGGRDPGPWLEALAGRDPKWKAGGPRGWRARSPSPSVLGLERVRSAGRGAWQSAGDAAETVVAPGGGSLLLSSRVGRGQLLLLADASPLQNGLLDQADNAALGLSLAGPAGRPVQFVEGVHGYGNTRGFAALPLGWRVAVIGLGLAGLLLVAARSRRLGPPDPQPPPPAPPRRAYVEALASARARTHDPATAAAPVQEAARARLRARYHLDDGASPDELERAAERAGLAPDEARGLVREATGDGDLVTAGRSLARLAEREPR